MKVKLDKGAYLPTRAHKTDAGLDLYAPRSIWINAGSYAVIDTGVHVEIPEGYVGMLKSKSGLYVRHGISGEGTIDAGYTGSIICKLYNNSDTDYLIEVGHKIIQLVILPILTPELELADELDKTERGNNGFGSTGK